MRIEISDKPPRTGQVGGTFFICIIPETNREMAELERCLTVKVKFGEFRKWAHPDEVSYGFYGVY